jgi:hypothetical protein
MAAVYSSRAYDHLLDFLIAKASPDEILAFELNDTDKQRAIELLDKQDEGTLTEEESAELAEMREAELLIMALRAKALEALQQK